MLIVGLPLTNQKSNVIKLGAPNKLNVKVPPEQSEKTAYVPEPVCIVVTLPLLADVVVMSSTPTLPAVVATVPATNCPAELKGTLIDVVVVVGSTNPCIENVHVPTRTWSGSPTHACAGG